MAFTSACFLFHHELQCFFWVGLLVFVFWSGGFGGCAVCFGFCWFPGTQLFCFAKTKRKKNIAGRTCERGMPWFHGLVLVLYSHIGSVQQGRPGMTLSPFWLYLFLLFHLPAAFVVLWVALCPSVHWMSVCV